MSYPNFFEPSRQINPFNVIWRHHFDPGEFRLIEIDRETGEGLFEEVGRRDGRIIHARYRFSEMIGKI